jgi:hypothetical protein
MFRSIAIAVALLFATVTAQAALLGRAALTPGGTDYQAYYDDVLNITWLADANYAQTSGYDTDGVMLWPVAESWIASLNSTNHLGVDNWRLPFVVDTGTPGCTFAYSGTDCGYNVQTISGSTIYSEMAHLYYVTLGNVGFFNAGGGPTGCDAQTHVCEIDTGPFHNLQQTGDYWAGSEYGLKAWHFSYRDGAQNTTWKTHNEWPGFYAWAVRSGDISSVPIPAAVYLFGSALGLMGVMRRKVKGI